MSGSTASRAAAHLNIRTMRSLRSYAQTGETFHAWMVASDLHLSAEETEYLLTNRGQGAVGFWVVSFAKTFEGLDAYWKATNYRTVRISDDQVAAAVDASGRALRAFKDRIARLGASPQEADPGPITSNAGRKG